MPDVWQYTLRMTMLSAHERGGAAHHSTPLQATGTQTSLCCNPAGMVLLQDDNGFVYVTSNPPAGGVHARNPSSLALLISTDLQLQALSFKLRQGRRYLYACASNNAAINRLEIIYNSGQPESFNSATAIPINAPGGCQGVVVEDDGTIFYTGVSLFNGGLADHFVAKVCFMKGSKAVSTKRHFSAQALHTYVHMLCHVFLHATAQAVNC